MWRCVNFTLPFNILFLLHYIPSTAQRPCSCTQAECSKKTGMYLGIIITVHQPFTRTNLHWNSIHVWLFRSLVLCSFRLKTILSFCRFLAL